MALGYTLVYGVLRLINFAHSEIFMLGTFGALWGTQLLGIAPTEPAQVGFASIAALVVVALVATAVSGGSAVLLERIAYRPLRRRGANRLTFLISAIGASLFLQELFGVQAAYGRTSQQVPTLFEKEALFTIGDGRVTNDKVLVVVGALVMMVALDQFVARSRLGRGIRAVAQDSETATLMGVNIDRVVTLTFLLGGMMAGVAGALFVFRFGSTRYDIGFLLGVKAFTAAVLGGIGNLRGALLGGFALGLVELYGGSIFGTAWQDVIAFVALVFVLMFRPTGLLGESLAKARA